MKTNLPTSPIITSAPGVALMTDHALFVMKQVMSTAGVSRLICTDGHRTVEEQAAIMYKHCVERGVAAQNALYGPFGRQVIKVFSQLNSTVSPDEVKYAMASKIREIGPFNVSHHLCGGADSQVDVYDFAPTSVPSDKKAAFEAALSAHPEVTKWIGPPRDLAYHVEIKKGALPS